MTVRIREYKKRGKKGWEVDIVLRLPNGEVIRERVKAPVTSKSGAKFWGEQREAELLRHGKKKEATEEPKKELPTLAQFAPRFIEGYAKANRQKPSSINSIDSILRVHLLPRFGDRRLDAITLEDVQKLKGDLSTRAAKTLNNVLTVLNTMLKTAVEWGVIDQMPARITLVKVGPAPYDFFDFADYERLVEAAGKLDWRILATTLLAGDAGLRRGEIIALEQSDIDHTRRLITIQRSEWKGKVTAPKGGRLRRVPMTTRLAAVMAANRHLRGPRVFYRDDGTTVTPKVLRLWMEAAQRRAGLAVTGKLHMLRHTFCSHLAMRGAPALAIQELAGHTSLTTTMRYMHLSPSEKDRAIRLLDEGRKADGNGDIMETGLEKSKSPIPSGT